MIQRYRKRIIILAMCVGLLSGVGLLIAQVDGPMETRDETAFLQTTAFRCLWKVELSTIAARQAGAEEARQFAQHMATRYASLSREATVLAESKGIALTRRFDATEQNTIAYFSAQRGAGLDREYVSLMADDLAEEAKNFKREAKQGKDPDIQAFAARGLKGVEQDLLETGKLLRDLPQPILK